MGRDLDGFFFPIVVYIISKVIKYTWTLPNILNNFTMDFLPFSPALRLPHTFISAPHFAYISNILLPFSSYQLPNMTHVHALSDPCKKNQNSMVL